MNFNSKDRRPVRGMPSDAIRARKTRAPNKFRALTSHCRRTETPSSLCTGPGHSRRLRKLWALGCGATIRRLEAEKGEANGAADSRR